MSSKQLTSRQKKIKELIFQISADLRKRENNSTGVGYVFFNNPEDSANVDEALGYETMGVATKSKDKNVGAVLLALLELFKFKSPEQVLVLGFPYKIDSTFNVTMDDFNYEEFTRKRYNSLREMTTPLVYADTGDNFLYELYDKKKIRRYNRVNFWNLDRVQNELNNLDWSLIDMQI